MTGILTLPSGRKAVSAAQDGSLKVWDLTGDTPLVTMTGHEGAALTLAAFPGGNFIASGAEDYTVRFWNVETGETIRTLTGHTGAVTALAVTPDGRRIVSGSTDRTIRIWEAMTGRLLHTCNGHLTGVDALAISPDAQYVLAGETGRDDLRCALRLWDIETGTAVADFQEPHFGVRQIAFLGDGAQVISGSTEGDVKIWDRASGRSIRTLETHLGSMVMALMPGERMVLVGTQRPLLALWNLESGELLQQFDEPSDQVMSVAVTADARYIVAGCHNGSLNVYARAG
ncbi:MAG: WD40 repeat domain-containing protein [Anaerolineae bacterium]|nr:WD40 repeat domain-containing protein [Anaerolineae bacterium]